MKGSDKPSLAPSSPWKTLGEAIRMGRERLGWSQASLAARAGTNQQTVDRLERGQTKNSKAIIPLLDALGIDRQLLTLAEIASFHEGKRTPALRNPEAQGLSPDNEFPIYGQTVLPDNAFKKTDRAVTYWVTPMPLLYVRGSYGLIVAQTDMSPAFRPNEVALVHPWLLLRPDMDVVLTGASGDCLVRTLSAIGEFHFSLTRWSPEPVTEDVPRHLWPICHAIVGRFSVF